MERTKKKPDVARLQALTETISRAILVSKLGQSYDTARNLYETLGYPIKLEYTDFATQYSRQDIAQAIINRPASATWKGDLRLIESKEAKTTEFETQWEELEKRLSLKTKFKRLDKLTSLGSYSVLFIGFDDAKSKDDFKKPVTKGKHAILYVRPLGEGNAKVNTWVTNTSNPRYGLPEIYDITLSEPGSNATSSTMLVHHSRILHVVNEQMESEVYGEPVLKAVWNRLVDLEKLIGGSAEMFWKGARPGYHANVDKDFQMDAAVQEGLKDQIDEYEHNLRRILTTEGIDMKALEMQIADPKNHVDVQIQMISAITGIPKRILMGTERGELASTQDSDAWLGLIQSRREDFAEPKIIRPFVDICISMGILTKPEDGWSVDWSDLFSMGEKELAEVGRIRATALREYTLNPVAVEVVPQEAFFELFLGLKQEQINLISEMQRSGMNAEGLLRAIAEQEAKSKPMNPKPADA